MTPTQAAADRPTSRIGLALGVAVALLLGARLGYGWLEAHYAQAFHTVPIPRGSLERLPMIIGGWEGHTEAVQASLVKATDTDDYVNRRYRSTQGLGEVSLWIGYGGRLRDLVPHRPEICYPGNGYTPEEARSIVLTAADGVPLPCRLLHFARGDIQGERIALVDYYLVDGEYSPDVSLLRSRAMQFHPGGRYVAQVQIACTYDPLGGEPDQPVRQFAQDSAASIRQAVEAAVDAVSSAPAGKEHP